MCVCEMFCVAHAAHKWIPSAWHFLSVLSRGWLSAVVAICSRNVSRAPLIPPGPPPSPVTAAAHSFHSDAPPTTTQPPLSFLLAPRFFVTLSFYPESTSSLSFILFHFIFFYLLLSQLNIRPKRRNISLKNNKTNHQAKCKYRIIQAFFFQFLF